MKKLIIILLFLPILAMAQIPIGGTFAPNHPLDPYPLMDATVIKGNFMAVPDTNFMLDYPSDDTKRGISLERRSEGQLVYVTDLQVYYQLLGGTANSNWTQVTLGGSTLYLDTDRPTNYIGDGITIGNPNMRLDSAINQLLYAEEAPGSSIYGDLTGPFEKGIGAAFSLHWTATLNGSIPITEITVAGQSIAPTGATQSESISIQVSEDETFSCVVTAGLNTVTSSVSYSFIDRIYIGMLAGFGDPLDTPFVEPNGNTSSLYYQLSDSDILAAGNFPYSELKTDYPTGATSITNASAPARIIVVAPTSYGEPEISVDGSFYSSVTLQKSWEFINQYGEREDYKMWVLFTTQNANPFTFYIRRK